jgi:glycosyltransferase involved in cell wall biosynthesis
MKILYITNDLYCTNGWSRYSVDLINEVKKSGHEVLCVVNKTSTQHDISEKLLLSSELDYINNPVKNFIDSVKIRQLIAEFNPNIVHIIVEPYVHLFSFLKLNQAKIFLTVHGTYSFMPNLIKNKYKKIFANFLSNRAYDHMDCVVAVSNFTRDYLLKNLKANNKLQKKIRVINNGVNVSNFLAPSSTSEINMVNKILFVGAIKSRKGLMEAIDALKFYHDIFSGSFIFDIIGAYNQNDKYYQKLLKKIEEYKLGSMIFFRGKLSQQELEKYYRQADLFLMTPVNVNFQFEGFGLVYLEANLNGVPCIGSVNCGAEDAIVNNQTGYLVNPNNKAEVAEKINLVLNGKSINSKDCIDWAQKNSIKNKARDMMELYKISLKV